jgi:O-antigen/teichoic acid export membrane protein
VPEIGSRSGAEPERVSNAILSASSGFIGNASITLLGSAAGAGLSMCNEVLAARFLGISAYGLYALALMLSRTGEKLAAFGVPVSVVHYLPVQLSRGQRREALGTVVGALPLPLCVSLLFAVIGWLGSDAIASRVLRQPAAAPFIVVLAWIVPLLTLGDLLGHITRGFGRALPHVLIANLVPQLCAAAVLIPLFVWGGPLVGVAYAQLGGLAVGVAVGFAFVWTLARRHIGWVSPRLNLSPLYAYAVPVVVNAIMGLAIAWTDLFLLGLLADAATVGAYRGCMQIVLGFDLLSTALAAATAPVFTVLMADASRSALEHTYAAAVRLATILALPALLVIVVNASDLLSILGQTFAVAATALIVLAAGQFVRVMFSAAGVILVMGGRQRLEAFNTGLAAAVNLLLNLALIPWLGLFGAAVATTTSLIGLSVLRSLQLRRVLGVHTFDPVLLRVVAVTLPLALAIWWGSGIIGIGPGSGLTALMARIVATVAAFAGGLWILCLNAADRRQLLDLVLGSAAWAARNTAQRRK